MKHHIFLLLVWWKKGADFNILYIKLKLLNTPSKWHHTIYYMLDSFSLIRKMARFPEYLWKVTEWTAQLQAYAAWLIVHKRGYMFNGSVSTHPQWKNRGLPFFWLKMQNPNFLARLSYFTLVFVATLQGCGVRIFLGRLLTLSPQKL